MSELRREPGLYWVLLSKVTRWQPARYCVVYPENVGYWQLFDSPAYHWADEEFWEIGTQILSPEELKEHQRSLDRHLITEGQLAAAQELIRDLYATFIKDEQVCAEDDEELIVFKSRAEKAGVPLE